MNRDHVKTLTRGPKNSLPNTGGWKTRHSTAIGSKGLRGTLETSMVAMLHGWAAYANAHRARFESNIGEDYVLGPEWARIGFALRGLLNGELGRLDGGTLDGFLCDSLRAEGFDPDMETP